MLRLSKIRVSRDGVYVETEGGESMLLPADVVGEELKVLTYPGGKSLTVTLYAEEVEMAELNEQQRWVTFETPEGLVARVDRLPATRKNLDTE